MQKENTYPPITLITPEAPMSPSVHGGRAKCLQRLIRLEMPVPTTVALSFGAVQAIARGQLPDMDKVMAPFGASPLLSVRPSSQDPDWGGPGAMASRRGASSSISPRTSPEPSRCWPRRG